LTLFSNLLETRERRTLARGLEGLQVGGGWRGWRRGKVKEKREIDRVSA